MSGLPQELTREKLYLYHQWSKSRCVRCLVNQAWLHFPPSRIHAWRQRKAVLFLHSFSECLTRGQSSRVTQVYGIVQDETMVLVDHRNTRTSIRATCSETVSSPRASSFYCLSLFHLRGLASHSWARAWSNHCKRMAVGLRPKTESSWNDFYYFCTCARCGCLPGKSHFHIFELLALYEFCTGLLSEFSFTAAISSHKDKLLLNSFHQ